LKLIKGPSQNSCDAKKEERVLSEGGVSMGGQQKFFFYAMLGIKLMPKSLFL
jgi:hypothetical protein